MTIESPKKPVDERIQKPLDRSLYAGGRPSAQKIRNFLNGTWLGEPLHVVLKDVPIGAWTVAMVFDAFDSMASSSEFALAAEASIAIGILGAVGAAATGLTDWSDVDPPARKMGYKHRVGVDRTDGLVFPENFTPVLPASELADDQPTRAMHNGVPILLVRRGQRLFAMAETCAHFSGPLSEGKLLDDSIVCPYHSSRFALEDGSVRDGPAVHPQPCLQVRTL